VSETRYFDPSEFDCHDGTRVPEELLPRLYLLMSTLGTIREAWGGPIRVVSGYRSPVWNERIGGAKASRHMMADAADIQPIGPRGRIYEDVLRLHGMILRLHGQGHLPDLGGLGYYPGKWVHADVRPQLSGHLARWTGAGIGSENA
jgi:uncharacterized protein YcbK (DUF882 family)